MHGWHSFLDKAGSSKEWVWKVPVFGVNRRQRVGQGRQWRQSGQSSISRGWRASRWCTARMHSASRSRRPTAGASRSAATRAPARQSQPPRPAPPCSSMRCGATGRCFSPVAHMPHAHLLARDSEWTAHLAELFLWSPLVQGSDDREYESGDLRLLGGRVLLYSDCECWSW